MNWPHAESVSSVRYKCAFCDNVVASRVGWEAVIQDHRQITTVARLRICPHCEHPTYISPQQRQIPGALEGEKVEGVTDKGVEDIYSEARRAFGEGCFTASVLCCRKLLMHVAVSKGAKEGESFIAYVEYLERQRFVPPGCTPWVDEIRKKGNEANHEISIMTKEQAKELLTFCEMLLKLIFEFPAKIAKK